MAQPREEVVDGRHDQPSAVAILDVGGMNRSANQQTGGVGHDVALAPLDLLAASCPCGLPPSIVLTDWLSMTPADGLGWRPATSRACSRS
jgi:hypothetical protein